jgi:flagellin
MVIQHNISAINSYRNLGINQSNLSKNLEKLSSGYKINRAGDDAAGLAISEQMRSQINALNQAVANAEDAVGLIQTAEGALTETHSMLQRMTTLVMQAANGTYAEQVDGDTTARINIEAELKRLGEEISRISKNTDFNGLKPLTTVEGTNATRMAITFQIGPSSGETIKVDLKDMSASVLGVSIENGDISVVSVKGANESLAKIEKAINEVSKYRAQLGAAQNRLEYTVRNLEVSAENIQAAESRIRDTDMANEITQYTKNNILLQAAQSMLTQANATPQGVLSMLQ